MFFETTHGLEQDLNTATKQFELNTAFRCGLSDQRLLLEKQLEDLLQATKHLEKELFCPETSTERRRAINVDMNNRHIDIDVIQQQIETAQIKHNTALQDNVMLCKRILDIMQQLKENKEQGCVFEMPKSFLRCETAY